MRILTSTVFAFLMLVSHYASAAEPSPYVQQRAASVDRAIRILGQLSDLAREHRLHYPDAAKQTEIRRLLEPLSTVEDLSAVALACAALRSGLAEHQSYDSIFDYAEWACLERIASIPGEEAHDALEHRLKPILGADGHPSELFKELIERQHQLEAKPRS